MPKFKLLYFKNLLDIAFNKFFELYGDQFVKSGDRYVLSKSFNIQKLVQIFKTIITKELEDKIQKFDILQPEYYFIIGSCLPKDNILLQYKDKSYFPKKLDYLIQNKSLIKYILKENDIELGIEKFNDVCMKTFNSYFMKKHSFGKNVMFIKHNNLDCYGMFKILKSVLGKSNCVNMYEEQYKDLKSPIIAVNDLIDRYVICKTQLNKSKDFKMIYNEVKCFIEESLNNVN